MSKLLVEETLLQELKLTLQKLKDLGKITDYCVDFKDTVLAINFRLPAEPALINVEFKE